MTVRYFKDILNLLLNYFLETFDEFLIANYDEELRMEEISEVS
jgi:hypothetical protein